MANIQVNQDYSWQKVIRAYLNAIEMANITNKITLTEEMFEYLYVCSYDWKQHKSFAKTVKKKLYEFRSESHGKRLHDIVDKYLVLLGYCCKVRTVQDMVCKNRPSTPSGMCKLHTKYLDKKRVKLRNVLDETTPLIPDLHDLIIDYGDITKEKIKEKKPFVHSIDIEAFTQPYIIYVIRHHIIL